MRLSLRVQRHGCPPIDLLWTIKQPRGHTSPTISQLLEEVNQRIPLEAQGWGLEDYVVRVGGFECLHYSEVDDVLRDGDQVSIEPLETSDIRARRLGGRYQITPDGRHLIDGVSFGRRWYGQPARPTVRIPPRKRVKYTDDDEDDELDHKAEQLLKLLESFQDGRARAEQEDENENDSDWVIDGDDNGPDDLSDGKANQPEEDSSVLDEEIEALAQEAELNEVPEKHADTDRPGLNRRATRRGGILKGPATRAKNSNKRKKSVGFVPFGLHALGTHNNGVKPLSNVPQDRLAQRPAQQERPVSEARPDQTIVSRVVELGSDEESDASFSSSDSQSDSSGSFSDSESSPSGDSPPDEDSSEVESSSDESDSAARRVKSKKDSNSPVQDSKLNKGDLKVVRIAKNLWQLKAKDYEKETQAPKESQASTAISTAEAESGRADISPSSADGVEVPNNNSTAATPHVSPPGEGLKKTKVRNKRRRISDKIKKLTNKGLLQRGAKKVDLEKFMSNAKKEAMEAKREKLLAAVATGGVDVNDNELMPEAANQDRANAKIPSHNVGENDLLQSKTGISQPQASSPSPPFSTAREQPEDPSATDMNDSGKENVAPASPLVSTKPKQNESARRRAKLDLAGSRRMLFGSLGVRTPKNPAEEEQLRNRLAEVGKSRGRAVVTDTALSAAESTEGPDTEVADAEKDPNFWKTRINLFAVECVDENVKLSTPPFPFVQRWDPQQQLPRKSSKSGGKGKKRKRNDSQYYQGITDNQQYSEWQGIEDGQPAGDDTRLNYDEDDGMDAEPVAKARRTGQSSAKVASPGTQLLNEMNGATSTYPDISPIDKHIEDEDDLPPLPDDISSVPALTFNDVSPGAILAFRKLDMSAKTNYQPILSTYRTARVITVDPLTQYISLKLAKRDQESKTPRYDGEGNRIYGKFEMADDSDEDSEDEVRENGTDREGNGVLNVAFAELVEPKLVQAAEMAENVEALEAAQGKVGSAVGEVRGDVDADTSSSSASAVETSETLDGQAG